MEAIVVFGLLGLVLYIVFKFLFGLGKKPRVGKETRANQAGMNFLRYDGATKGGISLAIDGSAITLWGEGWRTDYSPSDILRAEVLRDDNVLYDTSSIGRAALGGALLLGPIGMLAGLGAKAKSRKNIHELAIKLYIRDMERPFHKVTFLRAPKGISPDHRFARSAARAVEEWNGRLLVLLGSAAT